MSAEQEVDRVLAYLRQHRNQYSLPALQQQLVASGQDPAIIEQAMALMQAEDTSAPRRNAWLVGFGFSFLNNAYAVFCLAFLQ